ncbi:hypothetical protein BJF78_36650 [Pseudonocardia sp. CNS-139]|nr:hypothetical protein BJF78_36650 [Pseudonocardia sp. CNS-139]
MLAAVLGQTVSDTALLDVPRLGTLRTALGEAVVTDGAGLDEMLALSRTLSRLDADGVTFATVPTGPPDNRGNATLLDTDAADLFTALRGDGPLPEAATNPPPPDTGPTPADVTVEVFNASDRSGVAAQVGETLRSLGFVVGNVDSADEPIADTVIRFSPDQEAAATLLAATVPSATTVPEAGGTGLLQLMLGRSFDDEVRAPAEPVALQATTTTRAAEESTAACS